MVSMNATIHPSHDICLEDLRIDDEGSQNDFEAGPIRDGMVKKSLGIFSIESSVRKRIIKIVSPASHFDNFILIAIFLNSIAIASVDYRFIDENYQPRTDLSVRNNIIEKTETIFTVIFTSECLLKLIAHGFLKGKRAYIRDAWNVFDLLIVTIR